MKFPSIENQYILLKLVKNQDKSDFTDQQNK